MMLNVTGSVEKDTSTVAIAGRVDSVNAAQLDEQIGAADVAEKLVLDAEKLEYISSAGLRVLLKYRKKHPDLELINASAEVYDILDMTGFTQMFKVKRAYRSVSVEGCEVIGRGANGEVYRLDPDTVVKVYLNDGNLEDIEHEREVARKALVLGIPTAISYDVVRVGEHYASMFEMLNAKSFSKLLANDPDKVPEIAVMYVELLKLIHSTEVPEGELPDQREVLFGWLADLNGELPQDVYQKLDTLCHTVPHDNHMIHGDYHIKNVMLQNGEVILIDMDTLAIGHPVLEMASVFNAYIGFYSVEKPVDVSFLGIPYQTGVALWKETLRLYYNTDDAAQLDLREKQAKTVGLIRLLRRSLKRSGDPVFVDYCKKELCSLANELTTLI